MLLYKVARGGAGTTFSSTEVFCLCPFALVFTLIFRVFAFFFLAPCAFSFGFYSVFRLHDVAAAMLDICVGWGGMLTFHIT